MAAAMKHNISTASHECDMNAMEPLAEKYQRDLQSTNPRRAHVDEDLPKSKSKSRWASEFGKDAKSGRSKSRFAYIFIGVGMLVCLVWSATLFWFLARGLLRLIF